MTICDEINIAIKQEEFEVWFKTRYEKQHIEWGLLSKSENGLYSMNSTQAFFDCWMESRGRVERIEVGKIEIVYDCIQAIEKQAHTLCGLLNDHGTIEQKEAYKESVYAVINKLHCVIGVVEFKRIESKRHKIIERLDLK